MRKLALLGALAAATAPIPAEAAVYFVTVTANVTGTTTAPDCQAGQTFPNCPTKTTPFSETITRYLGPLDLQPGDNAFYDGAPFANGSIQGIINNQGGFLTGRDLTYYNVGFPLNGRETVGTAATFSVAGGIPEPGTWMLMLLGFGAIGWSLRSRRRVALA